MIREETKLKWGDEIVGVTKVEKDGVNMFL